FINRARATGSRTSREYLSPAESFHPPIATVTLTPLARSLVTRAGSSGVGSSGAGSSGAGSAGAGSSGAGSSGAG
ncbi:hypothetical protein Bhyg_04165, partial [Pseudolycoriella hygida]